MYTLCINSASVVSMWHLNVAVMQVIWWGKWGEVSFAAHHSGSEAGYLKAADGVQRSDLPPVERGVRIQHNIRESKTLFGSGLII